MHSNFGVKKAFRRPCKFPNQALDMAKSRPVHPRFKRSRKTLNMHSRGVTLQNSVGPVGRPLWLWRGFFFGFFIAEEVEKHAAGYDWGSSVRLCASQFGVCRDSPLAAFTHSSSKPAVRVNIKEVLGGSGILTDVVVGEAERDDSLWNREDRIDAKNFTFISMKVSR